MSNPEDETVNDEGVVDEAATQESEDAQVAEGQAEESESLTSTEQESQVEEASTSEPTGEVLSPEELRKELDDLRAERDQLQKRVSGSTRAFQEHQKEMEELRGNIASQNQVLEEFKNSQTQAQLPDYDPQSPGHQNFQQKVPVIQAMERMVNAMPVEERGNAVSQWLDSGAVSQKDLESYEGYRRYLHQQQVAWADPVQRSQILEQEMRQANAKIHQESMGQQQLVDTYTNLLKKHADVYQANSQDFNDRFLKGEDPRDILHEYEVKELQAKVQAATVQDAQSRARMDAKDTAAKGNATAERDSLTVQANTAREQYEHAKETFRKQYGHDPEPDSKLFRQHMINQE